MALPMGTVLEQVFSGLDLKLTPPAGGVWTACGPCQVLAGPAVPLLQLVEARGEALVGSGHREVWLLLFTGSMLFVSGPGEVASNPALGLRPSSVEAVKMLMY